MGSAPPSRHPHDTMVCIPVHGLSEVTLAHLRPLVGRSFRTRTPDGRPVDLRLVEVQDNRPRRRRPRRGVVSERTDGSLVAESEPARELRAPAVEEPLGPLVDPTATRPFTLLFLGPVHQPLIEDRYDLELPWLPLPGLRLSPLGPGEGAGRRGLLYESVLD